MLPPASMSRGPLIVAAPALACGALDAALDGSARPSLSFVRLHDSGDAGVWEEVNKYIRCRAVARKHTTYIIVRQK